MPKEAPTSTFWKRLTSLAPYKGHTQTKLAKIVSDITGKKIGQSGVHKWKTGASLPILADANKLAAAAGTSAHWLLNDGAQPAESADPGALLTELMEIWQRLSHDAKVYVVGAAKFARSTQFTGNAERRSGFQQQLVTHTEIHRKTAKKPDKVTS